MAVQYDTQRINDFRWLSMVFYRKGLIIHHNLFHTHRPRKRSDHVLTTDGVMLVKHSISIDKNPNRTTIRQKSSLKYAALKQASG